MTVISMYSLPQGALIHELLSYVTFSVTASV